MTKEIKNNIVNNVFNNTVNEIIKKLEACNYKNWCLNRQIDIEFNKPNFNSKRFVRLCLLKLLNKAKFKDNFRDLCSNARSKIRSLVIEN